MQTVQTPAPDALAVQFQQYVKVLQLTHLFELKKYLLSHTLQT